jgi:septum site-determining protein MinC
MDSPALPQGGVATPVSSGTPGGLASAPWRRKAFDIKGTMAPLTVLKLRSTDLMLIERQLRVKIAELPQLFLHAPVMLDFAALEEPRALSIPALVSLMKSFKLVPVAGTNVPEAMRSIVTAAGLGLLAAGRPRPSFEAVGLSDDDPTPGPVVAAEKLVASEKLAAPPPPPPPPPPPAAERRPPPQPVRAPYGGPVVITNPVRSGQVVYAQNNDLVVMAPVNAGAQVIADGHVHVYAALRGRAVAGAQGLPGARLFVQKLEAELVAIAGVYMMADEIPPQHRGRSVQVYLENGHCQIAPL